MAFHQTSNKFNYKKEVVDNLYKQKRPMSVYWKFQKIIVKKKKKKVTDSSIPETGEIHSGNFIRNKKTAKKK